MTDPKLNPAPSPSTIEVAERKKSTLFEVLNRPIHFPFRKDRTAEVMAEAAEPQLERFARLRDRLRRTRQNLSLIHISH